MRVLITGGHGHLGARVAHYATHLWSHDVTVAGHDQLDITDSASVVRTLAGETPLMSDQPHVVVNCAAWTNVNKAETNRSKALAVNALAAGSLALACRALDIHLIQISTDYVFRGDHGPSHENTPTYPINAYGISKLLGEKAIRSLSPERSTIVRLGWLYGPEYPGCAPMLCENESYTEKTKTGEVKHSPAIVADYYGHPTFVGQAARVISQNIRPAVHGNEPPIVHLSPDEPSITWYDLLHPHYPDIQATEGTRIYRPVARPQQGGLIPSPGWATENYEASLAQFQTEIKTKTMWPGRRQPQAVYSDMTETFV